MRSPRPSNSSRPWSRPIATKPEDTAIVFRVGLHLGDVIVDGNDIYGDDVNVAARLETEAPPGGIVVSRAVREAVKGRLKATLHALGELTLKNIERPIRAFRVEWKAEDWPDRGTAPARAGGRRIAASRHAMEADAHRDFPSWSCPSRTSAAIPSRNISSTA